jgi:hypothetical protein
MKKLITLLIIIVSIAHYSTCLAQPQPESYNVLKLRGSIVTSALILPGFAFYDFTFKKLSNEKYTLEGVPKDKDSVAIGPAVTLESLSNPARPLHNLEKGHLYLSLNSMKTS